MYLFILTVENMLLDRYYIENTCIICLNFNLLRQLQSNSSLGYFCHV